ncbi:MAG: S16 family serine protease [Candidatus Woesearchaeota archaeon]|jgi:uncharacterized protein|nr:S16 family serine protease [Candidatus Woesearchaeota archaeon]MDP7467410.1 S16 family serine protease [Candidatus Woesearchaeota archaeon]MDP7647637.1 S16 family serine protease [Candidatus Woesearchaeota archaeon]
MKLFLLLGLVLLATPVLAETIPLLALTEQGEIRDGIVAELSLETRRGTGRVFLDTFPLTRVTTQTSMRFAQQVACSVLEKECKKTDFFFTIRAPPGIIGGPSAGGVATILTVASLQGKPVKEHVAMTGTINSGGSIGPVGGTLEKIQAAQKKGITTVLIPPGTKMQVEGIDIDPIQYGKELGLTIIEVSTIEEALPHFLPNYEPRPHTTLTLDATYADRMKRIAEGLCSTQTDEYDNGKYYAAASACFRSRVNNARENPTEESSVTLQKELKTFEQELKQHEILSLTDVQTIMMVNERLRETKEAILNGSKGNLAYAKERLYSAQLWSTFLGTESPPQILRLKEGCQHKIAEAEERYSYVVSITPPLATAVRITLDQAYAFHADENYIDCLYSASKAKAEANAIMGVIGIREEALPRVLRTKLDVVNQEIARGQTKGVFPIIGYSYYELAESLSEDTPTTSLLFAEYALEFATLNAHTDTFPDHETYQYVLFGLGSVFILIGGIVWVRNI